MLLLVARLPVYSCMIKPTICSEFAIGVYAFLLTFDLGEQHINNSILMRSQGGPFQQGQCFFKLLITQ